jgi:eukaryotic-like serine/threonine-protein kinase
MRPSHQHRSLLLLLLCTLSYCSFSQEMFRGGVHRIGAVQTNKQLLFDYQQWRFDAGTPIRSTPLIAGGTVYFGTSGGQLFCLDRTTGKEKWRFFSGHAINSSPAHNNGKVFFSDNQQTLYALNSHSGQKLWQYHFGKKLDYPWRFDYYYSSPLLTGDKLYIGADDGYLYCFHQNDGKLLWKFRTTGLVRSSPTLYRNSVLVGDTEGLLFSINAATGKEQWRFAIEGHALKNENFGYDRRAIISSPAVSGDKVIIGGRDGFLYCLDGDNGTLLWKVDHNISWVNTSAAIKDSIVVTGTSDGRFVQGVHLHTGKELWKTKTTSLVWSSPLICNNQLYAATFDGQLLVLDLETGKRLSQFYTTDKILSSPVIDKDLLFVGADNGYLFSLGGRPLPQKMASERFVYYEPDVRIYFQPGADTKIKTYLEGFEFTPVNTKGLIDLLTSPTASKKTIVFATNYFPKEARTNRRLSLLTSFLNKGNRIILLGNNPAFYHQEDSTRAIQVNFLRADTLLGVNYAFNDTRGHGGIFPAWPTAEGKQLGLPSSWVSSFSLPPTSVSLVLGTNENGAASAWIKRFDNGGELIQIWMHPETPTHMDCIIKLSEEIH